MTDERLDKLLAESGATYRVPREPRLDDIWAGIDAELSAPAGRWQVTRRTTRWSIVGVAAAAALALGVGVGRWSAPRSAPLTVATAADQRDARAARQVAYVAEPMQRATSDYLGATEALLKDLQTNPKGAYGAQANSLLVTTRLLLDSPSVKDSRLHSLLEDLELILAQIATLPNQGQGTRNTDELKMIRSALDDRDVVPRLRTAVVTLASFEN